MHYHCTVSVTIDQDVPLDLFVNEKVKVFEKEITPAPLYISFAFFQKNPVVSLIAGALGQKPTFTKSTR
jgi:hypothetical protein